MDFENLGLQKNTIKALLELGIERPTTVQIDVIPSILEGRDIFTIAPERSGKTYSYVLPLVDLMTTKKNQNILIITPDSKQSANVSDCFARLAKYHAESEDNSNVIIATPDLILELNEEEKIDLSSVHILVVDDINVLKKRHQLANLEKVLEKLPADKQNIVFTNRRSKETQSILDKILKMPAEIKVDKNKTGEAESSEIPGKNVEMKKKSESSFQARSSKLDVESEELVQKFHIFGDKTPKFLLIKGELAHH